MRSLTFLCQSLPDFSSIEVIFFKLLSLILMLLWATYLVREIFLARKDDPLIAVQLAVIANNIGHLTEAHKAQLERENSMWVVINGMRKSLTTLAADHAHLEGQAHSSPPAGNPIRPR